MDKPKADEMVILTMTDTDDDDFEIIADNVEFRENILFVCDRLYSDEARRSKLNIVVDDFKSPARLVSKVKEYGKANKKKFRAVIGLDEEYHYRMAEALAIAFDLRFYPRRTMDLCSNKYLQRVELANSGIKVPSFQLIDAKADIRKAEVGKAGSKPDGRKKAGNTAGRTEMIEIGFPNVLKLMTGVGSAHMHLNMDEAELRANLAEMAEGVRKDTNNPILKKYSAGDESGAKTIDPASQFLIEEFIGGDEYSCDYIIEKGKARVLRVVRKVHEKGDFGFFAGFYLFSPDDDNNTNNKRDNRSDNTGEESDFSLKELEAECARIAAALGITFGVCMMDFKFDKGQFVVIETTLRPGVATFVELMAGLYGFISLSIAIRQRLGLPAAGGKSGGRSEMKTDGISQGASKRRGVVAYINSQSGRKIKRLDFSYLDSHKEEMGLIKVHRFCKEGDSCVNVAYVLAECKKGAKDKNGGTKQALSLIEEIRKRAIVKV
jgi:hypothetical protein